MFINEDNPHLTNQFCGVVLIPTNLYDCVDNASGFNSIHRIYSKKQ